MLHKQFRETGCLFKGKSPGQPGISAFSLPGYFIFQQDGATPHWLLEVRKFLKRELWHHWIDRSATDGLDLHSYPPRSHDLTSWDFFLWGFAKDLVFIPHLPRILDKLSAFVMLYKQLIVKHYNVLGKNKHIAMILYGWIKEVSK